ncbi:hypothetical protein [Peribacillus aracenensis]|uniref:hypothetical protein n=1 Tax=Peribacillus aracenensis TaxID=2976708 RepID=UPI0021A596E8|nr:hypothetical protein [Peribacillus sp. BBB004]
MNVFDNSPSTGYISWTDVNISYKGKSYKIANANTNLAYIYWKFSDPTSFYGSNIFPTLGPDDLLVFVNKSGTHLVVPNTTILDGSLFVPGSILANALSVNSVTSEKILAGAISAAKLAVGAVGADKIAAGAVIADKIAAGAVDVGKLSVKELSAISSDLGNIKAGDIKGVTMNLAGGNFIVDTNGNVTLKGNLDGATGTFSGAITSNGTTFDESESNVPVIAEVKNGFLTVKSTHNKQAWKGYSFFGGWVNLERQNLDGTLKHSTYIDPSYTSWYDGKFNGSIDMHVDTGLNMNNKPINNVDRLTFADPGGNEGIEWLGGNGWKIFEAPDDASNTKGALQFFTGSTRRFTVGTTGNIYLTGTRCIIQGTGGSFEAEGKLVLQNTSAGTILTLGSDATASPNYVQSIDVYNRTYSPAANMYVTSSGVIGRTTSATKYKLEIEESKLDSRKILNLIPKTWYDKSATEAYADALTREQDGEIVDWDEVDIPEISRVPGLIAEDVIEAGLPEYVIYGPFKEDGTREVEGLMYDRLWTPLIPITREHEEEIALLKEQVKSQDEKISNLEERLAALEAKINI